MSRRFRLWAGLAAVLSSAPVFWACAGMDYLLTGPLTFLCGLVLLVTGALGMLGYWFAPRRAVSPAKPRIELAAPDAGRDQCRVCGLEDLAYWDDLDAGLDAGSEERHVVAYGPGRAHRDCAAVVPYVAPVQPPVRPAARRIPLPQPGEPVPPGYRRIGRLAGANAAGAISLCVDALMPELPAGTVIVIAERGRGAVRESAVADHTAGTSMTVIVCRGPLELAHPADVEVFASPLLAAPETMPPVNGPLRALVDSQGERFLASLGIGAPVVRGKLRDSIGLAMERDGSGWRCVIR